MKENGITNPYTQIGILSVIGKETGYIPKSEYSYSKTGNNRLRKLFGNRLSKSKYSDDELNNLKKDDREFFNVIYAKTVGNRGGEDGYNYRGRGYNQLTGIENYRTYGKMIGMGDELVDNPDLVNDREIAAKIAIAFFTKGKSASTIPEFNNKEAAAIYFADLNAGGSSRHRQPAIDKSKNFEVIESP
jgi:predicted chitinase